MTFLTCRLHSPAAKKWIVPVSASPCNFKLFVRSLLILCDIFFVFWAPTVFIFLRVLKYGTFKNDALDIFLISLLWIELRPEWIWKRLHTAHHTHRTENKLYVKTEHQIPSVSHEMYVFTSMAGDMRNTKISPIMHRVFVDKGDEINRATHSKNTVKTSHSHAYTLCRSIILTYIYMEMYIKCHQRYFIYYCKTNFPSFGIGDEIRRWNSSHKFCPKGCTCTAVLLFETRQSLLGYCTTWTLYICQWRSQR